MEWKELLINLRENNYKVFDRPYELNIIGIRSAKSIPNKFDDTIYCMYKDSSGRWILKNYPATTDAGTYYLLNPISELGTAMLKEGQYIDAYKQGYHKGQYLALVQVKPVTVYRDYDRDAIFDIFTKETTGLFGINIHKSGEKSIDVNNWSAGCQVFANSSDFSEFMSLTNKHKELYGDSFTYTLLDERARKKKSKRYLLYITIGAMSIGALATSISLYFRKKK